MKGTVMNELVCPGCKMDLKTSTDELVCLGCRKKFPIINGVADFSGVSVQSSKTVFGWSVQWGLLTPGIDFLMEDARYRVKEWNIDGDFFRGKSVLDAGCGNGRWSKIVSEMGAGKVWGIDLSDSVFRAREDLKDLNNVNFVKSDIAKLPFRDEMFDFIVATEVLQHTVDPERSLGELKRVLKKGGRLTFSLYMVPENLSGRIKMKVMGFIRNILFLLPYKVTFYFTKMSVFMYKHKIFYPLARLIFLRPCWKEIPVAYEDKYTWALNHDSYIAKYQYVYTKDQTKDIISKAGFKIVFENERVKNDYVLEKVG